MQLAITFLAIIGGMVFSLVIAVLAEEIIFGQVFRLFFAPARLASKELVANSTAVKSAPKC